MNTRESEGFRKHSATTKLRPEPSGGRSDPVSPTKCPGGSRVRQRLTISTRTSPTGRHLARTGYRAWDGHARPVQASGAIARATEGCPPSAESTLPRMVHIREVQVTNRGRTAALAILALVAIAGVSLGGLHLANNGTQVATLDPSLAYPEIELGVDLSLETDPHRMVFRWGLMSTGFVEVEAYVSDDNSETVDRGYLILFCGTRFDHVRVSAAGGSGIIQVDEGGSEEACDSYKYDYEFVTAERPAWQRITFNNGLFIGDYSIGKWTDSRGGQRVARTPFVRAEPSFPDLESPAADSTLTTSLAAPEAEVLGNVSPQAIQGGTVRYDIAALYQDSEQTDAPQEISAVQWSTEDLLGRTGDETAEEADAQKLAYETGVRSSIRSANARWTVPNAAQEAEWSTLLGGVLLGVGAAGVVEFIIALLRSERSIPPAASSASSSRVRPPQPPRR